MISVKVHKQGSYPVAAARIKQRLSKFLASHGIVSDAEVSVAVVGERKIKDIAKRYLGEKESAPAHNVLSFTQEEKNINFVYPPDNRIYLGEILVCYPKVAQEASGEGKLIEDKLNELIEHSALHLLGIHHKE